jgi:hypothetical protein
MLDAAPLTGPPLDGNKTARLANRLLDCCFKAKLNLFEVTTALGLVAETSFENVPEEYFEAWVATLRRKLRFNDA